MAGIQQVASDEAQRFPWYEVVSGDDLEQGDILEACPVFELALPSSYEEFRYNNTQAHFDVLRRDVIVLTQSCDITLEHPKVKEVLICQIWNMDSFGEEYKFIKSVNGREQIRRGIIPNYLMLNASKLVGFERPIGLVDFHRVFSLPIDFVRTFAQASGPRLRLLPPYREHLGQAFARYFMRVGLPVDIPPFKK